MSDIRRYRRLSRRATCLKRLLGRYDLNDVFPIPAIGRPMYGRIASIAGKTDWEITEILQISRKTVNYHVEQMNRRYGFHSRIRFVAEIVQEGGIEPAYASDKAANPRQPAPLVL